MARIKCIPWKAVVLTMLVSLVGTAIALAASGDLDGSFDDDGKVTTDIDGTWSDWIYAVGLQSDGKIVAAGTRYDPSNQLAITHDVAVARYEDDGDVDPTFTEGGMFHADLGGYDEAADLKIAADDKIVVSGHKCAVGGVDCDVVVGRMEADGDLDPGFNGGHEKYIDYAGDDNRTDGGLALMSDGRIVVAGTVMHGGNPDFAVYRLTESGGLDPTFSGDGKVRISFGAGRHDVAHDLMLFGSKIVIVGESCDATHHNCNIAVARLTSSGVLDTTFSGDGKQTTDFGAEESAFAVARDPNGKIVVAGGYQSSGTHVRMAVARYNLNGTLDTTFSRDGKRTLGAGQIWMAQDVLVQGVGKIVLAGMAHNGTDMDVAVVRLRPAGGMDTSFGDAGTVLVDILEFEAAFSLVRQPDGKYVAAGAAYDGMDDDFALVRLLP